VAFTDKTLTCADCGQEFLFSADEQEFYASKGFGEPKRCRSCRAARRNEREGGGAMGAAGGFSRPPRPERELFDAVCANCGQPTKVPFQPRGDRPVYCRDCFARVGPSSSGAGGYRQSNDMGGRRY
jgi:CxxC-x17-CxxC domain-containing protein